MGEEREARHLGAGVLDDERGLEDMEDGDEEETEDEHDAPRSPKRVSNAEWKASPWRLSPI